MDMGISWETGATIFATGIAAFSAWSAYKSNILSKQLARRNLRLEVHDLNRALNEEINTVRKIHAVRKDNLHASFSHAGLFYSSSREKLDEEWEKDRDKLEAAIKLLEPEKRTFEDLEDHQLEDKLVSLKSIERAFKYEQSMSKEWESDRDRLYKYVNDARVQYS
jgi:hypothetical protein